MRKTYGKPRIYIESFQLNAAIATACNTSTNKISLNSTADTCMSAESLYFSSYCDANDGIDVDEDSTSGNADGICYHAPTPNIEEFFLIS